MGKKIVVSWNLLPQYGQIEMDMDDIGLDENELLEMQNGEVLNMLSKLISKNVLDGVDVIVDDWKIDDE
jgi:hypothetical protein